MENAGQRGLIHALAAVLHPQTREVSGARVGVLVPLTLVYAGAGQLELQLTAATHRVARVHGQVQQHLLHLRAVCTHAQLGRCR